MAMAHGEPAAAAWVSAEPGSLQARPRLNHTHSTQELGTDTPGTLLGMGSRGPAAALLARPALVGSPGPGRGGLGSPQPLQCNKVLSTGRVSVRVAGGCLQGPQLPGERQARGWRGPWQGWTQVLGRAWEWG